MTDEAERGFLQEALKDLHKNETFERSLGRILRAHQRDYQAYVQLIGAVRERARREGVDLLEAARREASGG